MGYQFKGQCLETLLEMHQRFAQDCSGVSFNAMTGSASTLPLISVCTASGTNVSVQAYDIKNNALFGTATILVPPQYSCTYSAPSSSTITNADAITTAWLVVSVWVVAWGIRKMTEVLRK